MSALSNDPHAPAERHDIGQVHLKGAAGGRILAIADRSGGILASDRAGLREDAWSGGGLQYLRLARLPDDLHAIAGDGTGLLAYQKINRRHNGVAAARVYAGIAVSSARKLVPGRDNIGKDEAMRLVMKGHRGVMCHDQADEFDIARAAACLFETCLFLEQMEENHD